MSSLAGTSASLRPSWTDLASIIAIVTIWTGFLILGRFGIRGSFTAWDLAFLRFAFAAAAVLPLWWMRGAGRRLGALAAGRALALALSGGIFFTCIAYAGFSFAPAAHGGVLMTGTLPFWVALVAWFALGERIGPRKLASLLLILLGVLFLGWQTLTHAGGASGPGTGALANAWRGDILFPFASASWAVFVVLLRRWQVNALDATIASAMIACALYTPVYLLWLPKQIGSAPWLEILWQGVFQGMLAMVLSMWLYTRVVQAFGPSRTTMVTSVCPPLAALIAVPVLGEPLSALILLGLAAVTAGMVLGVTGAADAFRADVSNPTADAQSGAAVATATATATASADAVAVVASAPPSAKPLV